LARWCLVQLLCELSSPVIVLRGNDGMLHSASNNKAEILNAQFKSAYTQEDLTNLPDVGRNTITKLPEIRVMEKGVLKLLQNLKVHKAAVGTMLAFLQSLGTVPSSSDVWNIVVIAGVMTLAKLFSNLGEMVFGPAAL
jgi:hypothetical protein